MPPTKLYYLQDMFLLEREARVVETELLQNERGAIILDETIFYPQGGGQPFDQGVIERNDAKFFVEEVRFFDGIVKHIGKFEGKPFEIGEKVLCRVDKDRRELHSRIHSAGHVIDFAMKPLRLNWIPRKGYHFSDGPYVEYEGDLGELDREKLREDLEKKCNEFVSEGQEVKTIFMEKEEMKTVCDFVPDYIPEGKPGRVVMFGGRGVPCGGTHVANLRNIYSIIIRKLKLSSNIIRVAYDVER